MKQLCSVNFLIFIVSVAALVSGLGFMLWGHQELAHGIWTGGAVPALVF